MTHTERDIRRREIGGSDPLDRRLASPHSSPLTWLLSLLRTRSALGFAPSLTPAVIFLPVGVMLGPRVLGVLSPSILTDLDFAVTIALAVLGGLVGIALGREVRSSRHLFAAASVESLVTIAAVAAATIFFVRETHLTTSAPLAVVALALGLCASASSATSADPDSEPAAFVATGVADLDDVVPIVVGWVGFTVLTAPSVSDARVEILGAGAAGLAVGAIGILLFERAESSGERGLFVLGALALAGGAAAYLNVSPLLVGLIAGLCWTIAPGQADRIVQDDLRIVQHPVVVLLLVVAGALWVPSTLAAWLLVPYVLCRLAGKITGAWVSSRFLDVGASDLAAFLMSPGVLAIAFALNIRQLVPGETGDALLAVAATGTAAFELFALAVVPHWRQRTA